MSQSVELLGSKPSPICLSLTFRLGFSNQLMFVHRVLQSSFGLQPKTKHISVKLMAFKNELNWKVTVVQFRLQEKV